MSPCSARGTSADADVSSITWDHSAAKNVIFETALEEYRDYSKAQNRSHESYVEPALNMWERELNIKLPLARVSAKQI